MKNVVLCSDGTGNAAGQVMGTNVWRVFEAVDRDPTLGQVAFHDDGVGTEESKLPRTIGGAFGWGLTRNLEQLYAFLVQNFDPGDNLYLFGFSRGAFTIRVLANILYFCGIAGRNGRTPSQIDDVAKAAVAAYKRREFANPHGLATREFRERFGRADARNVDGVKGWFPIRFVGVWDTVEAIGLPFDELTDAFSWLIPLRLKYEKGLRENDLHPLIEHAYHALATDDERHTFHPVLWIEDVPYARADVPTPSQLAAARGTDRMQRYLFLDIDGAKHKQLCELKQRQVVKQVWFAGMHANVGGGYNVDSMSHVPLLWIMKHATAAGLKFSPAKMKEYAIAADLHGKMYDSRAGLGVYYRYRPRDLQSICAEAGLLKPTIHASVLQRIQSHTQQYAPTGVPEDYAIEDDSPGLPKEQSAATRMERHRHVDQLIWQGRALYLFYLAWTIAIVLTALALRNSSVPDVADWHPIKRFVWAFVRPIMDVLIYFVPDYFASGLVALRNSPFVLGGFLLVFAVTTRYRSQVARRIAEHCNLGWKHTFSPATTSMASFWKFSVLEMVRTGRGSNKFASVFHDWIVPLASIGLVIAVAIVLGFWWAYPAVNLARQDQVAETDHLQEAPARAREVEFFAKNPMQITPVVIEAGAKYRITATVNDAWRDWTLDADPDGLTKKGLEEMSQLMKMSGASKRVKDQPWFKLMGSIGPDETELIPIGSEYVFWAKTTGRLYLFVNDASGLYCNNKGSAKVRIERLTN